jgi:hypothetical protein
MPFDTFVAVTQYYCSVVSKAVSALEAKMDVRICALHEIGKVRFRIASRFDEAGWLRWSAVRR